MLTGDLHVMSTARMVEFKRHLHLLKEKADVDWSRVLSLVRIPVEHVIDVLKHHS